MVGAAALSTAVLCAHAWVSLSTGFDVNHVSGVWLALARDLNDGIFYRDLIDPAGFGGTRYFPLFFALIALFARGGLDIVAAGHAASITGAIVLCSGALALTRRLGMPTRSALPVVLLTVMPYFVQASVFAIRVEPLGTGLGLWGLSLLVGRDAASLGRAAAAAICFTLAITAKPTTIWAPAGAVAVLLIGRRWSDGLKVLLVTGLCVLAGLAGVQWLSDGRFGRSLAAVALAGENARDLFSPFAAVRLTALVTGSRLLMAVLALAAAALAACRRGAWQTPAFAMLAAAGVTALVLGTPGTILTNHVIELYVTAVLFVGWCAGSTHAARAGAAVLCLLLLWTSGQDIRRISHIRSAAPALAALRPALERAVHECGGRVFAESPIIPLVAHQPAALLDPFALRVAGIRVPGVTEEVARQLAERKFTCVVLDHDPHDPAGAAWYEHVHFGKLVIDSVLANYELRTTIGSHAFYSARQ